MTRDAANQDKLDAFSRLQDSLKGRNLKVQDHLDLAGAAREAGLVREAKHNILLAGPEKHPALPGQPGGADDAGHSLGALQLFQDF
jgi:hypothetical protein